MAFILHYEKFPGKWGIYLSNPNFRWLSLVSLILLMLAGQFMPRFFHSIQARQGSVLQDFILAWLPTLDLSYAIFVFIYLPLLYVIVRGLFSPSIFIKFLVGYLTLTIVRSITIWMVPLDPPADLVLLSDPFTEAFFYGNTVITKDLFFSGHTATLFLISRSLEHPAERSITLWMSIVLGVMLLFQHVHYTIDILGAIPVAYGVYRLTIFMLQKLSIRVS